MKYLLVFAALIATANALNCECSTCDNGICTVETGKCFSIEREIATEKDKPLKVTIKGCQDEKKDPGFCKQGFILMSFDKDFYLRSNITCCDKDSCNKDLNATLNNKALPASNLTCPSCFAFEKKLCEGKTMKCNSLQKKCFNMTGTVQTDSAQAKAFNARGCAVENTVYKTNDTLTFGATSYKLENVQLGEAKSEKPKNGASQISSCLSFAILLPGILWFLLDSFLY